MSFEVHAVAEQAFVLLDIGKTTDAVGLLCAARARARRSSSFVLQSWLAAAHGEALAADGEKEASLRAFDKAASLLPGEPANEEEPYVALDSTHLALWRGHALACFAETDAVEVLSGVFGRLDPSFARAGKSLRVDFATALFAAGEPDEACAQLSHANRLAKEIGSARQLRRVSKLYAAID
ncbi:hypothetical protein [Allokutzneria multivorans]